MANILKHKFNIIIVLAVVICYFSAYFHSFTNWDDDFNVLRNPFIQSFSIDNIGYIFSHEFVGMYVPFTMLSYMVNCILGGLNPEGFLAFNIIFHLLNALLVFKLMKQFFKNEIYAFFIALIFAVHPMNVEGVSWISARSNVLFSFFFLLAIIEYKAFKISGLKKHYYYTLILFLSSCFSKSAAVAFPLLIIALDWYEGRSIAIKQQLDKVPFLIISFIFGVFTIYFRSISHHLIDLSSLYGPIDRIFLVTYSFSFYIFKIVCPYPLNTFYVYPEKMDGVLPIIYYLSAIIPVSLVLIIGFSKKISKDIVFSILAYSSLVFLVLKMIPVGNQVVTDRYAYLPIIFILFGIFKYVESLDSAKFNYIASSGIIVLFAFLTIQQNKVWANNFTLYEEMIAMNPNVALPYYNRASAYADLKQFQNAEADFTKAIELDSRTAYWAYMNRGNTRKYLNNFEGAMSDYKKALEANPNNPKVIYNIGNLQILTNDGKGAINTFLNYVKIDPNSSPAFNCLGQAYSMELEYNEAIEAFNKALEINPNNIEVVYNRGLAFMDSKKYEEAINDFTVLINVNPNDDMALFNRGLSYAAMNKKNESCSDISSSARLGNPDARAMFEKYCR